MSRCNELEMWTVYDHPIDYPMGFIARKHILNTAVYPSPNVRGLTVATDETIKEPTLEPIRIQLRKRGLYCIPRMENDDPKIVEVWL